MTLKERLEVVKEYRKWFEETNGKNDFDLLDCPETFMAFLQNRGLLNASPKNEWIPVSEKLPEVYGEYLITDLGGNVRKDTYNDYFKKFNAGKYVIAWQPLPEPYKKGGAE